MNERTELEIISADPTLGRHADAIVTLMDAYARGITGGSEGLTAEVKSRLPMALANQPSAVILLAWIGREPVGLTICFEGFSTFACRRLLNIHDVVVAEPFRGRGIARQMMARVEAIAMERGCCKLTLEVLEGNKVAAALYRSLGFAGYELDPAMGQAMFWQKKLGTQ
jgi:ribosomal protein S18 acetylase RimI-like enzyme